MMTRKIKSRLLAAAIAATLFPAGCTVHAVASRDIDITYSARGERRSVKVKADPYFGTDSAKIGDRSLAFYRAVLGP